MELQRGRHPAISGCAWVLWDYPWNTLHGRRYRSSRRGAGSEGNFRSYKPWRPFMNVFFSAMILLLYFLVLSIFKNSPICCCSVAQSCLTLCNPMDCSMPDFPVLHYLPEVAQTPVQWVNDAILPSHPLSPSSPALNLSQRQGFSWWFSSSHQVAKVLELRLQHQTFQWIFRVDFL